ncbi:MAG: Fic family protein [archaeon]|nr:Fic family protein [archaeon]
MHVFGYREALKNVPQDIIGLVRQITKVSSLDRIRQSRYGNEFETISRIAMAASVKYSNAIEGIITSDDRINDLVYRNAEPLNHDEEEIAGYRDALDLIHREHSMMDFDRKTVMRLFALMNRRSGNPEKGFKKRDNAIISVDPEGRRRIVFRTVPASETEEAFLQLELAYMDERYEHEPLLLIPCVILDYLCIHPFLDGNGRTSRLLTELMLYNEGMDVCRYVSLDEHIAARRSGYYESLGRSSEGWYENTNDYFPFIRYFLTVLLECYIDLDTRFGIVVDRRPMKSDRIENLLRNSVTPMSKRQIAYALPDVSPRTIESVLGRLQKEGKVEKVGTYRDARYSYVL